MHSNLTCQHLHISLLSNRVNTQIRHQSRVSSNTRPRKYQFHFQFPGGREQEKGEMDASVARVFHSSAAAAVGFSCRRPILPRRVILGHIPNPCLHPLRANASCSIAALTNATGTFLPRGGIRLPFPKRSLKPFASSSLTSKPPNSAPFFVPQGKEGYFVWSSDGNGLLGGTGNLGSFAERGSTCTAVLLGWLGAEHKHLKRYAELYRSKGIRVVSFVVPPNRLLSLDLGRGVERRIAEFSQEIASWVSEADRNGKDCCFIFHTFSNTGWLAYGSILDNLQSRGDVLDKIKGCVVDSGADAEINPQVWAAGFCAALLKKRSSLKNSSFESTNGEKSNGDVIKGNAQDKKAPLLEIILMTALQWLFSFLLGLPDVKRRLTNVLSALSKKQPNCPQLYLYSTADKVIPYESVEHFVCEQKAWGRTVHAHNFISSPHVDHLRSFPQIYSSEIDSFLKECLPALEKKS